MACHSHAANVRIVFFSPLICWGFCSKKLYPWTILQIRGEPKKSCCLLSLLLFFPFPLFCLGSCGWFTYSPIQVLTVISSETQKHRFSKVWPLILLPLCYLNRCAIVAPALTGTPPHWFISPVGLLAAAGDRTEEPGLSHQGNESEKREEGEEHYYLLAASLCSQATLCSHLPMPHIQMQPISAFIRWQHTQTFKWLNASCSKLNKIVIPALSRATQIKHWTQMTLNISTVICSVHKVHFTTLQFIIGLRVTSHLYNITVDSAYSSSTSVFSLQIGHLNDLFPFDSLCLGSTEQSSPRI